jgi:hypothetical protein
MFHLCEQPPDFSVDAIIHADQIARESSFHVVLSPLVEGD